MNYPKNRGRNFNEKEMQLCNGIFGRIAKALGMFNGHFKNQIENEFKKDLDALIEINLKFDDEFKLYKDPRFFSDPSVYEFVQTMKEKYKNGCPSSFYKYASKKIKREYDSIHKSINFMINES
jgi:hypothetical protein